MEAPSWKLINEVTGRKASVQGKLEGDTQEDRVNNWYNHFSSLLGKSPTVGQEDEDIEQIFPELDIRKGPFTMEEYRKAKAEIKMGKAAGNDEIRPEVLKLCDLDNIVLDFCNRAHTKREAPSLSVFQKLEILAKEGITEVLV